MTDEERWGIVYVPKAGVSNSLKRWNQIREYLEFRKVKYDVVQSGGEGSIERITRMLIDSGHQTIVVVGGDEALNDAINAIMFSPREIRQNLTLGIVPNGIGNDFASYWGLEVDNYKKAIHSIIEAKTKKIDVGYCSYQENGMDHIVVQLETRMVDYTVDSEVTWNYEADPQHDHQEYDRYFGALPLLIHLKDGSVVDMTYAGGSVDPVEGKTVCQKGEVFETILPPEDVVSVTVGDIEIPVG